MRCFWQTWIQPILYYTYSKINDFNNNTIYITLNILSNIDRLTAYAQSSFSYNMQFINTYHTVTYSIILNDDANLKFTMYCITEQLCVFSSFYICYLYVLLIITMSCSFIYITHYYILNKCVIVGEFFFSIF